VPLGLRNECGEPLDQLPAATSGYAWFRRGKDSCVAARLSYEGLLVLKVSVMLRPAGDDRPLCEL
jgi:hypothetical protein